MPASTSNGINIQDVSSVLFESAAEGLIVTNRQGEIQIVNPRISEMFGYNRAELIGEKVEILIPTHLRPKHRGHRKQYQKHPVKRTMGIGLDLSGQRKDGSTFPVEVSLNHFQVDGEQMTMALVSDVTERKKADIALQNLNQELEQKVAERTRDLAHSQHLYRLIARNFPNGIINVFDRNLCYVFVEGQELYRLGINSKRLAGTSYLDRLAPEVRDDIRGRLMEVFDGHNQSFEIRFRDNVYMINAVGLADEKGEITQILVVEQNITRLKKAEDDIRQALDKERQLGELKSRFVSMASHEFRTPLTTIQSSLALLQRYLGQENVEDKQQKHIRRIRTSVHHLTNILNDFLSIDKLEEGRVEINFSSCNLPEFMEEVVEEMKQMTRAQQEITYRHSGADKLECDPQMIKNILHNLISNAIKYSDEDGRIDVETAIDSDSWTIEVNDNGIGIPAAEQKHLFDRFFRAHNVTHIQGTGLGLSITAKYVDLLGGQVSFQSKEGEGTRFRIELPLQSSMQADK